MSAILLRVLFRDSPPPIVLIECLCAGRCRGATAYTALALPQILTGTAANLSGGLIPCCRCNQRGRNWLWLGCCPISWCAPTTDLWWCINPVLHPTGVPPIDGPHLAVELGAVGDGAHGTYCTRMPPPTRRAHFTASSSPRSAVSLEINKEFASRPALREQVRELPSRGQGKAW